MTIGVYKIENTKNGRFYIGSSSNIKQRWDKHETLLRMGTHGNRLMQEDYQKYGMCFEFSVLERFDDIQDACSRERQLLHKFFDGGKICYNLNKTVASTYEFKGHSFDDSENVGLTRKEASLLACYFKEQGQPLPQGWVSVWRLSPSEIEKKYQLSAKIVRDVTRRSNS